VEARSNPVTLSLASRGVSAVSALIHGAESAVQLELAAGRQIGGDRGPGTWWSAKRPKQ